MTPQPPSPKLYHITHVGNLASIAGDGLLRTDAEMTARGGPTQTIGMTTIKRRRIEELEVTCHPGTRVGEYVPFYFCPRSIMLYVLHRGNHSELNYRGGQEPIVHLEADLHTVERWARANGRRWAFSLSNAGARYATFCSQLGDLRQLDWEAIAARDFRAPKTKEGKQAEFLVQGQFPFELVEQIGVRSEAVRARARAALAAGSHRPPTTVRGAWYF